MTNRQIKEIAKGKGLIVRNMNRENIIRKIQKAEGNVECFSTDKVEACKQSECLWKTICKVIY